MHYEELLPDPTLADLVRSYWWFNNTTPAPLDYTILPDGSFDLLIHFKARRLTHISLTGLWTKQVDISIDPGIQIYGIRFRPLAAEYIFQTSITDILDDERPVEKNFWQISQTDFSDRQAVARHFDKTILDAGAEIDPKKKNLFDHLFETKGNLTVTEYAEKACWTSRQINRYFNDRFGISLKKYGSILKIYFSLRHIQKGRLYPEQNFFDQAHFIKSIQQHTGSTPENLHKNKNDRFLQLKTMGDH